MTHIHYFPRYSQKENFCTNNSLLLMYRLYQFNQLRFEKFLKILLTDAATDTTDPFEALGLQFQQQMPTGESVADGFLYQDSIRILIETKRSADAFGTDQLHRHLSGFASGVGGFLILLSPERAKIRDKDWAALVSAANAKNVTLACVTFEEIITAARKCLHDYDEDMQLLVDDYEDFCSNEDLLPEDRWTIFVPPCGPSHEINILCRLYFCPEHWNRRKAKYFGMYYEKAVRYIGEIGKIVACEFGEQGYVVNENTALTSEEKARIEDARQRSKTLGWDLGAPLHKFLPLRSAIGDKLLQTDHRWNSRAPIL